MQYAIYMIKKNYVVQIKAFKKALNHELKKSSQSNLF